MSEKSFKYSVCVVVTSLFLHGGMMAQDIHFTQYFNNALHLNPANTGNIPRGELRFTGLQRTQWKSVTTPFNTFYLSGDIEGPFKADELGMGLSIMNDMAGDSRFRTFSVQGLLASGLQIGQGNKELRGGIQLGFTQQYIDDADLRFDAQYNGSIYDPSADDMEQTDYNKVAHLDLGLGLAYVHAESQRIYQQIGLSLYNINSPDVSFQSDKETTLDSRFNAHAEASFFLTDQVDIVPSVQYMSQGAYTEMLLGTRFRYVLRDDVMAVRNVYLGAYGRLKDAASFHVGMDYDRWTVGLSYDMNLSSLEVASQKKGGLEIAVIYMVGLFREELVPHRKCPVYL